MSVSKIKKLDEKQRKKKGMTSPISLLERIWKISHSYPGCSFTWKIRVVYFLVKDSYPCNNKISRLLFCQRMRLFVNKTLKSVSNPEFATGP